MHNRQVLRYLPIFFMLYLLLYSRSELYSRAEAMYLTVGPTGDIFLVITRYIYLDNIELLQSLHHSY
ncbi:phage membrane protein [Staphylococcus aureus subsp. aureus HO 5096 0412]|nr:phage membrane protein [Staphylococcus aureus subsp. aureus HO 5096 0412]